MRNEPDAAAVRLAPAPGPAPDSPPARPVEPAPPAVETLLLPAPAAARLCGVSVPTWRRMTAAGRCPAPLRPSPGCVRWRREELLTWIESGCPDRKTWEALRASANANGRPRQAGR